MAISARLGFKILTSLYKFGTEFAVEIGELCVDRTQARQRLMKIYRVQNRKSLSKKSFDNALFYLKRKGYIGVQGNYWYITSAGMTRLAEIELKQSPLIFQRWDRKWRILFFDVPEHERTKRAILRSVIKRFHFKLCQQSVWVCPYPVTDQVRQILKDFDLQDYCVLLEIDHATPMMGAAIFTRIINTYKFDGRHKK